MNARLELSSSSMLPLLPPARLPLMNSRLENLPTALMVESFKYLTAVDFSRLLCVSIKMKECDNQNFWLLRCPVHGIKVNSENHLHAKTIFKMGLLRKRIKNLDGIPPALAPTVLKDLQANENLNDYFNKPPQAAGQRMALLHEILALQGESERGYQENLEKIVDFFLSTPGMDINLRIISERIHSAYSKGFPKEAGMSLLDHAMAHRRSRIACNIIRRGADIQYHELGSYSLLEKSFLCGLDEAVKLLVQKGANFRQRLPSGLTPLWKACQWSSVEMISLFGDLERRRLVNEVSKIFHQLPLDALATVFGYHQLSEYFSEMSEVEGEKQTILHYLAQKESAEIDVLDKVLVEMEKEAVNLKDQNGKTALYLAAVYGRSLELVKRLIKAGADTDILEELKKKCQEDYNQNYINSDLESIIKMWKFITPPKNVS